MAEPGVAHIAGMPVTVGSRFRQRCAWCGSILIDDPLDRMMYGPGSDPTPMAWEPGSVVVVDGGHKYVVTLDGTDLPDNACAVLDPEVTA